MKALKSTASHARRIKRKGLARGQPHPHSKLTAALTRKLCATLGADSIAIETACRLNDISKETYYNWYDRGKAEPESPYGAFTREVDRAQAKAELANHRAAMLSNPAQILFRRFPLHYPSEKLQAEITGKDGGPLSVNAGIQVVIESTGATPNGSGAAALTPFCDEREGSPWHGRTRLSTDAQGYIFDEAGKLVGVLRDLPQERAPAMPVSREPVAETPYEQSPNRTAQLAARIEELTQQIATLKANGNPTGIPGRLGQMVR
jgi:hypothetical protein